MNNYISEIKKAKTDMATTVVIDLDGVIVDFDNCPHRGICDYSGYPDTSNLYRDRCPLHPDALEYLKKIKDLGLNIIIHTSRVESERSITTVWLIEHKVPYSKLVMNKPRGIFYADDLGHKFINWNDMYSEIVKVTK